MRFGDSSGLEDDESRSVIPMRLAQYGHFVEKHHSACFSPQATLGSGRSAHAYPSVTNPDFPPPRPTKVSGMVLTRISANGTCQFPTISLANPIRMGPSAAML